MRTTNNLKMLQKMLQKIIKTTSNNKNNNNANSQNPPISNLYKTIEGG